MRRGSMSQTKTDRVFPPITVTLEQLGFKSDSSSESNTESESINSEEILDDNDKAFEDLGNKKKNCKYGDKCKYKNSTCKYIHEKKECDYGDKCIKEDCMYLHNNKPKECKYGDKCKTGNCRFSHNIKMNEGNESIYSGFKFGDLSSVEKLDSSYFYGKKHNGEENNYFHNNEPKACRYGTLCKKDNCRFLHNAIEICKYGDKCNYNECKYLHNKDFRSNKLCNYGNDCKKKIVNLNIDFFIF